MSRRAKALAALAVMPAALAALAVWAAWRLWFASEPAVDPAAVAEPGRWIVSADTTRPGTRRESG